ncbi:hypothetical protein ABL849_15165 [Variovorax sp. 375MFSha3.1]|uniref:Uncharacterized protein n=1 Tax=Variovorax guangxiensis TaxID=1775474 RepID=A0A840FGR4_9BURK|nr:hypothetical protein [Variovorax guangxiensis]MBB4221756.1 hypothetical protein [Variovorax guangxiensis]
MTSPKQTPHQNPDAVTTDEHDSLPTQHNKAGNQPATPKNEPRRTPESRSDRESHVGGSNQLQARRGGAQ